MKLKIIALLIVVSFLTSCGTESSSPTDFRTGSDALEMSLVNTAVEDFYENENFEFLVEFFNRGTSDIANGEFFVSGYDLNYLTLTLDPKYINIEGKDEYNPEGRNSQILEVKATNVDLPSNSEEFEQTIKVIACYEYSTYASAEVCIDPDPNGRRVTKKICNMGSVSPGSQGAPIVVTRVEPIVSKNDLRFNIEFANQGDGTPYDRTISNWECFTELDRYQDRDRIDLIKVEFSGKSLSCTPNNPLRLVDGKGRVSCECNNCIVEYMDAFNTKLGIEFQYGYRDEITKNVRILAE